MKPSLKFLALSALCLEGMSHAHAHAMTQSLEENLMGQNFEDMADEPMDLDAGADLFNGLDTIGINI